MSRHSRILEDGKELVVGWDGPLSSFFGQVFDNGAENEDDYLIVDVGGKLELDRDGNWMETGIDTVAELASELAEHGIQLTEQEQAQLAADRQARGDSRTKFQAATMDMFDLTLGIRRRPREDDNES